MTRPVRTTAAILLAGAGLVALPACSIVSGSDSETVTGIDISSRTLASLEPGVTSRSDAIALLGAPSRSLDEGEGARLLAYEYRREKVGSGSVFLIFSGSSREVTQRTVFLRFRDDVLAETWVDGDPMRPVVHGGTWVGAGSAAR